MAMQGEHFDDLTTFRARGRSAFGPGPAALVIVEDEVEIGSTFAHLAGLGFGTRVAFAPGDLDVPVAGDGATARVEMDTRRPEAFVEAVNAALATVPAGLWLHYCYNAEYLFFPFCETRRVGEMLAFHTEERREAMLTYVVDLYADGADGVDRAAALMDETGYFALARPDPEHHNHPRERQLDFFGGLRWRYEEHVEPARRRIDRIGLFRAKPGLRLRPDHTFSEEEYNTFACPWHNNLTAAVCSFRAAKALRTNPVSRDEVGDFRWAGTVPFRWESRQLMDLGLMEPGQWV